MLRSPFYAVPPGPGMERCAFPAPGEVALATTPTRFLRDYVALAAGQSRHNSPPATKEANVKKSTISPQLEPLEDRTLPSGFWWLDNFLPSILPPRVYIGSVSAVESNDGRTRTG